MDIVYWRLNQVADGIICIIMAVSFAGGSCIVLDHRGAVNIPSNRLHFSSIGKKGKNLFEE